MGKEHPVVFILEAVTKFFEKRWPKKAQSLSLTKFCMIVTTVGLGVGTLISPGMDLVKQIFYRPPAAKVLVLSELGLNRESGAGGGNVAQVLLVKTGEDAQRCRVSLGVPGGKGKVDTLYGRNRLLFDFYEKNTPEFKGEWPHVKLTGEGPAAQRLHAFCAIGKFPGQQPDEQLRGDLLDAACVVQDDANEVMSVTEPLFIGTRKELLYDNAAHISAVVMVCVMFGATIIWLKTPFERTDEEEPAVGGDDTTAA